MGIENVPHDEWIALLERSRQMECRARHDPRIWRELAPLNRRIRALAVLPTTKDTWPTRQVRP